jgi:hypothetical protein
MVEGESHPISFGPHPGEQHVRTTVGTDPGSESTTAPVISSFNEETYLVGSHLSGYLV